MQIMRSIWHCSWFLIPVLLFLIGALIYTWIHPYGAELVFFNGWRTEPWNAVFKGLTTVGEFYFWLAIALGLAFYRIRYSLIILGAGAITGLVAVVVKHFAGVPRPGTFLHVYQMEHLVQRIPGMDLYGGYNSMPSGHTMVAFTMWSLVTLMMYKKFPLIGVVAAAMAVLVGISRVFLLQHFLVDVIAGALFGLLISDLVWQIHLRFFQPVAP